MRLVRWLFGVIALILVVAVVSLMLLPKERIARIAADQLSRLTGRDVAITGDVAMTFWPVLGVSAGGLEVGNADWADNGAMLTAANAAIGIDASALLRGEIRITNIAAHSPTIRLEQRADGRASWRFTNATGDAGISSTAAQGRPRRPLSIQKLTVTDATLIYVAEGAAPLRYEDVDLALDWPDRQGPAKIEAAARPMGEPIQVEAKIDAFDRFLEGAVTPVTLRLTAPGGGMTLTGRASLEGAVEGALWFKSADTSRLADALGAPDVILPEGLGRKADVKAQLTLTPDRRLFLRDLVADLGGNRLEGAADLILDGTPRINAELRTATLDLSALTERHDASAGTPAAPAATDGWPDTPLDASVLSTFDGEARLRADAVNLGDVQLGPVQAVLRNDASRLVADIRELAVFDGMVTGEFVVNNRNSLSVGGQLNAQEIRANLLLSSLAGIDRFSGTANAEVSFLGSGQSIDAMMKSLRGNGSFSVGRGTIEGIDLDALLGSFDVQGGTTVFDSLTGSFAMQAGVLRNDDLTLLLPNFNATGAGQVGLGERTIDYTLTPKALHLNGDRGLAIPVHITGPWADPSIKADVKAAIDLNFGEEKARAEQKVKQKLEEKLTEELGLAPQEGQSVEDAVKDKLEGELKRGLLELFE